MTFNATASDPDGDPVTITYSPSQTITINQPRSYTVTATASDGNGGEDSQSQTVYGITVSLVASPNPVDPNGNSIITVAVNAGDADPAGLSVSLANQEVTDSGGHSHWYRPLGSFDPQSGVTDGGGQFQSTFGARTVSGSETITASVEGAAFELTIDIRIAGLGELGAGSSYVLVGQTTTHPSNHYGTSRTRSALQGIAGDYHDTFPGDPLLAFNDMSLLWGGLFDINANWQTPHSEHRLGTNCDLRIWNVPEANRDTLAAIIRQHGGTYLDEGDHWHLRF